MNSKVRQVVLPLLAALIWGVAFVFQSVSTEFVEPFTFTSARSVIGAATLGVVLLISRRIKPAEHKKTAQDWRRLIIGGTCCGTALAVASSLQQVGIADTSAGKTAFITALYIVIVPAAGMLFGRHVPKNVLLGIAFAVAGLYCLCMTGSFTVSKSDFILLICAFCFAGHILTVDHFVQFSDAIELSCVQFIAEAVLCGICAFLFETPSLASIYACIGSLLYVGVMSSGVAFTLQIIAQKGSNPEVVSLLLSLESLFGAIAGAVMLHESLTSREILGAALMLAAIVLAQLPEKRKG